MKKYLEENKKTYDILAPEFKKKINLRINTFFDIANTFEPFLHKFKNPTILELGPGSGNVSKILSERGYSITVIPSLLPFSSTPPDP